MSNAILPLVLLGSMGSSAAAIAYGIKPNGSSWESRRKSPNPFTHPC